VAASAAHSATLESTLESKQDDNASVKSGGSAVTRKVVGGAKHLPAARLVHLSEDLDVNPYVVSGGNKEDEPWFMRKLLRKAARGGAIHITPGALGHDSDDSEGEEDDPDEKFDEMDFAKVGVASTCMCFLDAMMEFISPFWCLLSLFFSHLLLFRPLLRPFLLHTGIPISSADSGGASRERALSFAGGSGAAGAGVSRSAPEAADGGGLRCRRRTHREVVAEPWRRCKPSSSCSSCCCFKPQPVPEQAKRRQRPASSDDELADECALQGGSGRFRGGIWALIGS